MSLKIRLSRGGAKKRPFYRIVVTDSRNARDGRFIERLGTYNPMLPREHDDRVILKQERIRHWLDRGAQPSERVAKFLGHAEIIPMPANSVRPKKSQPKAKAQQRLQDAADAKKAAEDAPPPPPVEEAPVEEAVIEEAAVEEAPVEEVAVEEAAAEEAPAEEASAEEASVEEAPVEEAPVEEAPAEEEAAAEETPAEDAPAEEEKTEE